MSSTMSTKEEPFERKKVKKKISKAQMQLMIIRKKQCDAKALEIVEHLLEPNVDPQWLLCNLRYINKSHMEDVIEERAIIKLCGYVLCNKTLTVVITQQYHISTKKNKVYDVTRRKNFCSSCCYGACNYLLEQMLTSPLWLREKEEVPTFKFLSDGLERSTPGDEIHVRDTDLISNPENKSSDAKSNMVPEDDKTETLYKSSESDICEKLNATKISSTVNETKKEVNDNIETSGIEVSSAKSNDTNDQKDRFSDSKDINNSSGQDTKDNILYRTDTSESNDSTKNNDVQNTEELVDAICRHKNTRQTEEVCTELEEVCTELEKVNVNGLYKTLPLECNINAMKHESEVTLKTNTCCTENTTKNKRNKSKKEKHVEGKSKQKPNEFFTIAMHIENNVREWITEDTLCLLSGEENTKSRLLDNVTQHDKYVQLCKKLNKLQLEDERDDRTDLTKNTLKPLPHLSVLQEEGKKMEIKVRAFYKGSMVIESPKNTADKTEEDDKSISLIPLTDAHAPNALRRRIFLDKLNRILPDLIRALATSRQSQYIHNSERSALIKALVSTFSLSATNIIFKTAEWTLAGLIIIKMLSIIDPQMKALLATKQASMYISMILMSYKLDSNYLDRLVIELTDNTKIFHAD